MGGHEVKDLLALGLLVRFREESGVKRGFSFVQSIISTNLMKAITVRQPWAWAIIYALKNIENRGWPINYRGDILIHAAKTCTKKEYQLAREFCQGMGVVIPELISLRRGQVIGIVTIVDCKFSQVASGWGMPGQYHWKLENPREITPIPYIGRLGIFEVPDDLVRSAIAS